MLNNTFVEEDEDLSLFSEINITPLTDVFLVLLIIFMVTSSAVTQSGVKVNLPKAGAASSLNPSKGITISIDNKNNIYLGDKRVNLDNLELALKEKLATQKQKNVVLAGDKEVMLGLTLQVMNIAKRAGAKKFGLATTKANKNNKRAKRKAP